MHTILRTSSRACRLLSRTSQGYLSSTSRTTFLKNRRSYHASPSEAAEGSNVRRAAYCAPYPQRTHTCGGLTAEHADSRVVLTGWLLPERKINKKFSFFGLRDSYGTTQLFVPAKTESAIDVLSAMRDAPVESTVLIEGIVRARPESQRRPQPAGDVEIIVTSFTLLNPADRDLPFIPSDAQNLPNEEIRLRHRYLDLRRPTLTANIKKRSDVAQIVRNVLHQDGFTEVETPVLLKSTPEGAREFLVPTRVKTASALHSPDAASPSAPSSEAASQPLFYALPQSPQQPKQLLVASGAVDRYYQLARCFRDEDGRKDRQPEFTQVDLEMAWVSWGEANSVADAKPAEDRWRIGGREVRDVVEKIVRNIWTQIEGVELPRAFQVMTYDEAMGRYGSDKPDLRFGLEIQDITSFLPSDIVAALAERDEILEALILRHSRDGEAMFRQAANILRREHSDSAVECIAIGSNTGSTWIRSSRLIRDVLRRTEGLQGEDDAVNSRLQLSEGDTIWLARRQRKAEGGSTSLGRLRLSLANRAQELRDLALPTAPHFLWITEFPLFTRADEDKDFLAKGRWSSSHHPFTAPMWEDIENMYAGKVDEVRGQHYDLVLNGVEVGGGSVRVHDPVMQEHIFSQILQLDAVERASFGHLLHALRCGAPPHGGFAFGFDRLMAILCKTESIRDVIAFPKTSVGTDLLFKSPAPATLEALVQYGIRPQ